MTGSHGQVAAVVVVLVVLAVALWPARVQRFPAARAVPGPGGVHDPGGDPGPSGCERVRGRMPRGPVSVSGAPWRRSARVEARERALAELVAALAAPLRAGVSPAVAVAAAAPTFSSDPTLGPVVSDLSRSAATGAPVAEVWCRHARLQDNRDLAFIGQAWALSELTGAPLADALACCEQVLRARARGRERLSAAAAGPRASMAVLCFLPASGPVVGSVMGVDPLTLYFSSPVATCSLVLGVGLGLGAWRWSRRILRVAG